MISINTRLDSNKFIKIRNANKYHKTPAHF